MIASGPDAVQQIRYALRRIGDGANFRFVTIRQIYVLRHCRIEVLASLERHKITSTSRTNSLRTNLQRCKEDFCDRLLGQEDVFVWQLGIGQRAELLAELLIQHLHPSVDDVRVVVVRLISSVGRDDFDQMLLVEAISLACTGVAW
jgi:hypothetical protein